MQTRRLQADDGQQRNGPVALDEVAERRLLNALQAGIPATLDTNAAELLADAGDQAEVFGEVVLDVDVRSGGRPVTVGQVAGPHNIPPTALAKVLQQLVRAGLAEGARGIGGGYRLARPRSEITVLDVVSVFESLRPPGHGLHAGPDRDTRPPHTATLQRLFDEVDEGTRATLASVTLDTLVK